MNIKKNTKQRSPELQARINKTRDFSHKEVVNAGKIQFRLDKESMELLLKVADEKHTGAGVLARMWVIERLMDETSKKVDQVKELERRLRLLERKIAKQAAS